MKIISDKNRDSDLSLKPNIVWEIHRSDPSSPDGETACSRKTTERSNQPLELGEFLGKNFELSDKRAIDTPLEVL